MKKELKDYLHLYLGCEVYIFPADTVIGGWLKDTIIKYPSIKYKILLTIDNLEEFIDHEYLPILRPLSDMTEEETKQFEGSKVFIKATPVHQVGNMQWTPETFKYLLSIGIDIFGLINDGLAIDKTTLIPTP